jgi:hypothetical protein
MKILSLAGQPKFLLVALIFGGVLRAWAQDFGDADASFFEPITQTTQFGISPFFGYRFGGAVENPDTGTKYSFKDAPAYGLFLDYAPTNYFGRFELLWSRQDSRLDFHGDNSLGKVDVTVDEFQIGGDAEFGSERLREYASAHVGATYYSSDGHGNDIRFSFSIGTGLKAFLTKNVYLRADLCGFCTVVAAEGSFIYANGVTVASFSGSTLWQGQASVGFGITF